MAIPAYMPEDIDNAIKAACSSTLFDGLMQQAKGDGEFVTYLRGYCRGYGDALAAIALTFGVERPNVPPWET